MPRRMACISFTRGELGSRANPSTRYDHIQDFVDTDVITQQTGGPRREVPDTSLFCTEDRLYTKGLRKQCVRRIVLVRLLSGERGSFL